MFHPFYDLDQRNPRLGAGLGLAIAKGFVTAMNGEIWIEDTPGGGATFTVSVPRDAEGVS
jgi:two-component system sensor histidine kinase KdpD